MGEKAVKKWNLKDLSANVFKSDKKVKVIFLIGVIGIALIFLSGMFGSNDGKRKTASPQTFQTEDYVEKLEKRIHTIVTNVAGVGKARVMITLENTPQYVYESEKKETNDLSKDYENGQTQKEQERSNYEKNVILVDGADGREALLKTTVEPKVKGVVVVCQGGENIAVEKQVVDVVTTALNISSNRVCVAKLSNG